MMAAAAPMLPLAPGRAEARRILARGSKSFALAGRLLPRAVRDDAAVVYAWCRRADDAIDLAPPVAHAPALRRLTRELDAVYAGDAQEDPVLGAFQEMARRRGLPREHAEALLQGLAMDAEGRRYRTLDELLLYCFHVAGTVGLMMSAVMGVRDPRALRRAVDLGIAMQLTNICRDVEEDWRNGRLYLPAELLSDSGAPPPPGQRPDRAATARAVRALLARADQHYRASERGLAALPFRCAVAVRAARLIYAAIGGVIARRGFNAWQGRAVVSGPHKRLLAARAAVEELARLPARAWHALRRRRAERAGGAP